MEELVDIIEESGKIVGKASKKEAHKKGLMHQAAHIWIFNSNYEVLLQKRSKTKDSYPGLWDISAAGHVSAGETVETSAIRELKEELGITVAPTGLKKIFTSKVSVSIPEKNWYNNELENVFLLKYDNQISDIKLLDGEVEYIQFVKLEKFQKELKNPETAGDYVPHGDYYFKVIEAIKKELSNQK